MKFTPAPPDEGYMLRFVSEGGAWEVGLGPVMYGIRVRAGRVGDGYYAVDLCGGADQFFTAQLLASVTIVLEALPEHVTPGAVHDLFPTYCVRPLHKDAAFLADLRALTRLSPAEIRARAGLT